LWASYSVRHRTDANRESYTPQGRPLSWQESQLVLAAVFQKFDIYFADTAYSLQIRQALTIKPTGMQVRVVSRRDVQAPFKAFERATIQPNIARASHGEGATAALPGSKPTKTVHILYGSNTGTCEGLAQRLASDAASKGIYLVCLLSPQTNDASGRLFGHSCNVRFCYRVIAEGD
jgi:cytochrome P450/NADPH-cytochrome P450 reductase